MPYASLRCPRLSPYKIEAASPRRFGPFHLRPSIPHFLRTLRSRWRLLLFTGRLLFSVPIDQDASAANRLPLLLFFARHPKSGWGYETVSQKSSPEYFTYTVFPALTRIVRTLVIVS